MELLTQNVQAAVPVPNEQTTGPTPFVAARQTQESEGGDGDSQDQQRELDAPDRFTCQGKDKPHFAHRQTTSREDEINDLIGTITAQGRDLRHIDTLAKLARLARWQPSYEQEETRYTHTPRESDESLGVRPQTAAPAGSNEPSLSNRGIETGRTQYPTPLSGLALGADGQPCQGTQETRPDTTSQETGQDTRDSHTAPGAPGASGEGGATSRGGVFLRETRTNSSNETILLDPDFQMSDTGEHFDDAEVFENDDGVTFFQRPGTQRVRTAEE